MRKYLLLIICLFLMAGCTKEEIVDNEELNEIIDEPKEEPKEEYKDDNPIKVGLYLDGKLMNEYNTSYRDDKDIISVDVYFTDVEDVGGSNTKSNFKKYYDNYENIDDYKIGFEVSFDTNEKHYEKVVLDPDVEFAVAPCIYIYLYDDVHQPDGSWYSHITKDDYNENTIFSSIKLYMAEKSNEVISPITLKVFTYNGEEDFDEEGHYRGISTHTLTINNK